MTNVRFSQSASLSLNSHPYTRRPLIIHRSTRDEGELCHYGWNLCLEYAASVVSQVSLRIA